MVSLYFVFFLYLNHIGFKQKNQGNGLVTIELYYLYVMGCV